MAVYRIYPVQDTFIGTQKSSANAGLDEIVEVGGYPYFGDGETLRILTQFSTSEIQDTINNKVSGSFSASLHYELASGFQIPFEYTMSAFPLAEQWTNGSGKFADTPVNTTGASWENKQTALTWSLSSPPTNATGSYKANLTPGGGVWYTGSNGVSLQADQLFILNSDQDLNIDVTPAVLQHYSGSIPNYGFIVKAEDDIEYSVSQSIRFKYFGADTNTIFPPYLEFKWDDSTYNTGSLSVLSSGEHTIHLRNNKTSYIDEGTQRFRIKARPKFPTRTFTTSSIYTTNYALPQNTYWALKDEYSEQMIYDFDTQYTKVSCDSEGSYFDVYMDTLQPERYYRLLLKTTLDGSTTIIDTDSIFKVTQNGH